METINDFIAETTPEACARAASEFTGIDMSRIAEWIPADAKDFAEATTTAIRRFAYTGGTGEVIGSDAIGNPICRGQAFVTPGYEIPFIFAIARRPVGDGDEPHIEATHYADGTHTGGGGFFAPQKIIAVASVDE